MFVFVYDSDRRIRHAKRIYDGRGGCRYGRNAYFVGNAFTCSLESESVSEACAMYEQCEADWYWTADVRQ